MTVDVGPGMSIVLRRDSLQRVGIAVAALGKVGDVQSDDGRLIVLGPFYSADEKITELEALGLEYTTDFFEVSATGGIVPEWCAISLRLVDGGH